MAETHAVTGPGQVSNKPVITYNDDDTYSIDENQFIYSGGDTNSTRNVTTKKGKKGKPDTVENKDYPYRYKLSDGTYRYIEDIHDAPKGAMVYKLGLSGKWSNTGTHEAGNSNGTGYNAKRQSALTDWKAKYDTEAQAEIEKRKAERATKAEEDAKKKADEQAIKDAKSVADAEQSKSFGGMSFADYNTDGVFDNNNSTAKDLIEKAQAEGMTYDEFAEAIKNTKWNNSKQLNAELESHKDGWKKPIVDEVEKSPEVKNQLENIVTKSPEELEKEEKERKKKERKEKWNKFVQGDEEKYREALKKNPSLVKMVFGDSGISLGDRMLGLGEMLATLGANTVNGIYAGVNKTNFTPVQGKMSSIYSQARQDEYNRTKERLDAANKANIEQDEIMSYLKNYPSLSALSEDQQRRLATITVGKELSKDEFIKAMGFEGEDSTNISSMYDEYKAVHTMWQTGQSAYKGDLENKITEQELISKQLTNIAYQLNTEEQLDSYIQGLERAKAEMKADKDKVMRSTQEEYFNYIDRFLGYVTGAQQMSEQATNGKSSGWDFSVSAKAGYGPFGIQAGGGYHNTTTSGNSTGKTADVLRLANIPTAERGAIEWTNERQKYVDDLQAAYDEQIAEIDAAIASAKARKSKVSKKLASVNDGIVKAPHMKQWLVREDGTKIKLNPNDSIYATKNKITTEKDDGQNVVQMEPEDRAVTIQKKLGHCGNAINKQCDYYLTKLK